MITAIQSYNNFNVRQPNNVKPTFTSKKHEVLSSYAETLAKNIYGTLAKSKEGLKSVKLPDGTNVAAAINPKYKYMTVIIDNYDRQKRTDKIMGYRFYLDKKINDSFCFDPWDQRQRLIMIRSKSWNDFSDNLLTPVRKDTTLSQIMNSDLENFLPNLL